MIPRSGSRYILHSTITTASAKRANDRKMTVEGMSDPVLPAGSAHFRSERRAPLAVAADNFG